MSQEQMQGPMQIMQLLQGVQASGVLTAGFELGVFDPLASGPKTAAQVGERLGTPPRSTGILLDALSVLGVLNKQGSGPAAQFSLVPSMAEFVVRDRPTYMGGLTKIFSNPLFAEAIPKLAEAVRRDGTVMTEHAETPQHKFWEDFAEGSAAMAVPSSMALDGVVGSWIDGRPKTRVLDIAAGSGIYGFQLARHPNVELTSLDWPNVLPRTQEWAKRLGVDQKRWRTIGGDLFTVEYGGPYDLIMLSHVYHHFDDATCAKLTKKVAAALAPGGKVAIHDFLTDGDNPGARMFSIVMLMWTRKGQAFGSADYRRWLEGAGLSAPTLHASAGMPTSWLLSEKR
jgi:C-methyltransferase